MSRDEIILLAEIAFWATASMIAVLWSLPFPVGE